MIGPIERFFDEYAKALLAGDVNKVACIQCLPWWSYLES